jgi:hypothetical protein
LLVQVPSYQVDDLRDVAFGCAHDDYSGPTEHWDEQRPPWMAFCFTNYVAWFYFHCDERRAPSNGPAGFKEAESNIGKIPG